MAGKSIPGPEHYVVPEKGKEPPHKPTMTAVVEEAMRTGISPVTAQIPEIPGDDDKLRSGDPDVDPLENEFSGESIPGGTHPSPDQNNVDEIGRAYGIAEEDSGELILGDDLIRRRDRRRWELDPGSKDRES